MEDEQKDSARRQLRRTQIEEIIARYPEADEHQIYQVLLYLKKEASAMDRAMISSNEHIRSHYQALCHDHYLDRLRPFEIVAVGIAAISLFIISWLSF